MSALRRLAPPLLPAAAFLVCVLRFDLVEALLFPLVRAKALFVERESLAALAAEHAALVAATSLPAVLLAFVLALAAARSRTAYFREALQKAAALGETIPTAALMALLVPRLGYGFPPVAAALFLYGLLPAFRSTLTGLQNAPGGLADAAYGCGMTERQVFFLVRLPWALPLVLQGVRVSLTVNIAAATLGATVGAGGLGAPIVSGIRSFDPVLILKGALPVAFMALTVDAALRSAERGIAEKRGGA